MFIHFQDLLTRHKILCAKFLEDNYDKVRWGGISDDVMMMSLSVL